MEDSSETDDLTAQSSENEETDSTLGSDISSISQTLSSSIMDYQYENGRRYHAYNAGKYMFPNDEQEANRLDLQHRLWLQGFKGKLYHAPLPSNMKNALDIGTGTGIWAIDFADQHPECQIIGTDLSPIQPGWVPPNCSFLIDDADSEREWIFPEMDFIHSRLLAISLKNWPQYFERCFQTLKPGGWIESQEYIMELLCDDDSCPPDDEALHWSNTVGGGTRKVGINPRVAEDFGDMMKAAGFVNITKMEQIWPVGPWMEDDYHKKLGDYMCHNMAEITHSTLAILTRVLGWSKEEAEILIAKARTGIKDPNRHHYVKAVIHYGQKPLDPSQSLEDTSLPEAGETHLVATEASDQSKASTPEKPKSPASSSPKVSTSPPATFAEPVISEPLPEKMDTDPVPITTTTTSTETEPTLEPTTATEPVSEPTKVTEPVFEPEPLVSEPQAAPILVNPETKDTIEEQPIATSTTTTTEPKHAT